MRRPFKARYHPDPERQKGIDRLADRARMSVNGYDSRPEIAALAAIIIADEGVSDLGFAKRKAAERLGLPTRSALPDNALVEAALAEHWAIFGGDDHRALIRAMREVALELMDQLAEFSPRLSGPVLAGTAHAEMPITLHLFPDDAKAVEIFLINHHIDYTAEDIRSQGGIQPRLLFAYDDFDVALHIHRAADVRQSVRSRDGTEIERASAADLRKRLEQDA